MNGDTKTNKKLVFGPPKMAFGEPENAIIRGGAMSIHWDLGPKTANLEAKIAENLGKLAENFGKSNIAKNISIRKRVSEPIHMTIRHLTN